VRDGFGKLVDLAPHGIVIDRIERPMQVVLQKQPDHRMGRNQIDLKAAMRGDPFLLLESCEILVRADCGVGIEQIVKCHGIFRRARLQSVARASRRGRVQPKHLVRFLQRGVVGEHRFEVRDPVAAFTGLAVGNAQEAPPQCGAHCDEHLVRIGEGDTADEMDVARRHEGHPLLAATNGVSGNPAQSK